MRVSYLLGAAALLAVACSAKEPAAPASETATPPVTTEADVTVDLMDAALISSFRSDEEKARDAWRHPKETLAFFGVEPTDTVAEIWPGGGWYTNILAPYLADNGELILVGLDVADGDSPERKAYIEKSITALKEKFSDPKFDSLKHSAFSQTSGAMADPGSVDVVLSFRNVHNWMARGYADKFFVDAYAALKPGGVLGVVEHRLPSTATQNPAAPTGYVHEDYVKGLAEAAGFEFVESSEINANPADTADHPFGVWTLPPNSRTQARDGSMVEGFDPATALAIGESDRMTLKFRKPE